jgi:hypothetical protein
LVPTAFPSASADVTLNVTGINFDKDNETYPGSVPVYSIWRCLGQDATGQLINHQVKPNSEPCTCQTPTSLDVAGLPVVPGAAVDQDLDGAGFPASNYIRVPAVDPLLVDGVGGRAAGDAFTIGNSPQGSISAGVTQPTGLVREVALVPAGQQTQGQITISAADIQEFQRGLGFQSVAGVWTRINFEDGNRAAGVGVVPPTSGQEADILICLQSEPRTSRGAGLGAAATSTPILGSVANSLGSPQGGARVAQSQATQDGSVEGGTQRGSLLLRFRESCSLADTDFCARRAADANPMNRAFALDPLAARWTHTCAAPELLGEAIGTSGSGVCINAGVEEFCGFQLYDRRYQKCCSSDRSLNALVLPNDVTRTNRGGVAAAGAFGTATTDEGGQVDRFPCPCSAPASDLGHPISCQRTHEGVPERCCTYTKYGAENTAAAAANINQVLRPQKRLFAESGMGLNPHIPASFSTAAGATGVVGSSGAGGAAGTLGADGDSFAIGNSLYPYYFCYNPQYQQCCDDGTIYDPGTAQCCAITGVQSIMEACPCMNDDHCKTPGQGGENTKSCCMQSAPAPHITGFQEVQCSTYANRWVDPNFQGSQFMVVNAALDFPAGAGGYAGQHPADPRTTYNLATDQFPRGPNVCPGRCIDNSFQVCCNGAVCRGEYERCCNDTCCNKYSASCITATGSHSHLPGMASFWHTYNLGHQYDTCTEIEHLDLIKAFFIFVVPFFFTVATFIGLLALSYKAASSISEWSSSLQVVIVFVAIFEVLSVAVLFWSPNWKYAFVTALVAYFTVQSVLADSRSVYVIAFFLQVFLWLFLVNPFDGNMYFNLATSRMPRTNGVWDATWAGHGGVGPLADAERGCANGACTMFTRSKTNAENHVTGPNFFLPDAGREGYAGSDGRWANAWNDRSSGFTFMGRENVQQAACVNYYHYFAYDPRLLDTDRTADPARRTFGLCSEEFLFVIQLAVSITKILVTLGVGLLAGVAFSRVENDKEERLEVEALEEEDQPVNTAN